MSSRSNHRVSSVTDADRGHKKASGPHRLFAVGVLAAVRHGPEHAAVASTSFIIPRRSAARIASVAGIGSPVTARLGVGSRTNTRPHTAPGCSARTKKAPDDRGFHVKICLDTISRTR